MNELSKDAASWITVGEDSAGQRIDNFLVRLLKGAPRSPVFGFGRGGEVRVNRGRVGADTRLVVGDVVRIPPIRLGERAAPLPTVQRAPPLPVLYEDDALVAIDKPAGLAVHG